MRIHITDLPLEAFELTLIFGLALGMFWQNWSLKRDKQAADKKLAESNQELKYLRHMLDRILMVEKGLARPGEDLDEEPQKERPARRSPAKLL